MKTVITSSGNTKEATFDMRFGRAAWFCIYDDENGELEFVENKYVEDQGGVGTKVSEMLIEKGVDKIISGDFGPKAKALLDKFKLQLVVLPDEHRSISEIITSIK